MQDVDQSGKPGPAAGVLALFGLTLGRRREDGDLGIGNGDSDTTTSSDSSSLSSNFSGSEELDTTASSPEGEVTFRPDLSEVDSTNESGDNAVAFVGVGSIGTVAGELKIQLRDGSYNNLNIPSEYISDSSESDSDKPFRFVQENGIATVEVNPNFDGDTTEFHTLLDIARDGGVVNIAGNRTDGFQLTGALNETVVEGENVESLNLQIKENVAAALLKRLDLNESGEKESGNTNDVLNLISNEDVKKESKKQMETLSSELKNLFGTEGARNLVKKLLKEGNYSTDSIQSAIENKKTEIEQKKQEASTKIEKAFEFARDQKIEKVLAENKELNNAYKEMVAQELKQSGSVDITKLAEKHNLIGLDQFILMNIYTGFVKPLSLNMDTVDPNIRKELEKIFKSPEQTTNSQTTNTTNTNQSTDASSKPWYSFMKYLVPKVLQGSAGGSTSSLMQNESSTFITRQGLRELVEGPLFQGKDAGLHKEFLKYAEENSPVFSDEELEKTFRKRLDSYLDSGGNKISGQLCMTITYFLRMNQMRLERGLDPLPFMEYWKKAMEAPGGDKTTLVDGNVANMITANLDLKEDEELVSNHVDFKNLTKEQFNEYISKHKGKYIHFRRNGHSFGSVVGEDGKVYRNDTGGADRNTQEITYEWAQSVEGGGLEYLEAYEIKKKEKKK